MIWIAVLVCRLLANPLMNLLQPAFVCRTGFRESGHPGRPRHNFSRCQKEDALRFSHQDEIMEPSLLSENLRSAVCNAHIGLIHVHIQPRRATFGMEKWGYFGWCRLQGFLISPVGVTGSGPAPPGALQIIKWPTVSASNPDANVSLHACANTHQQIAGGSSLHSLMHATSVKSRLDSQMWSGCSGGKTTAPPWGHCYASVSVCL